MTEQSIIIHFEYGSRDLGPLHALEEKLTTAIEEAGVGELDGDEVSIDGQDAYIYIYGPNAKAIFDVIEPILVDEEITQGAEVQLRLGPIDDEDADEDLVVIGQ